MWTGVAIAIVGQGIKEDPASDVSTIAMPISFLEDFVERSAFECLENARGARFQARSV